MASSPAMGKRRAGSAPDEIEELRRELSEVKDHLRVLTDVLCEIREDLQWLVRNGLPVQEEPLSRSPVLKRMALDPTADDWNERLEIARGDCAPASQPAPSAKASAIPPVPPPELPVSAAAAALPPPGQLFAQPGDQGRLF